MWEINIKALNKQKFTYAALVILLISSITFYLFREKEKAVRIKTEKQLGKTMEEKKVVETELVETLQAKERIEKELVTEKEKSIVLEKEIEGKIRKIEEKDREMKLTLDRLGKEVAVRKEVEARLMLTLKEKEKLEVKLRSSEETPQTIELEKIVIKPSPLIEGRILVVNKEHGFVITNLGSEKNLKIGDILSVYRNENFIGKVQIGRMKGKISAATILSDWQNIEFKENDIVKKV